MPLQPFAYPTAPHVRRHGPYGYLDYGAYKDWLRDEFFFRCVYCLEREMWYPSGFRAFSVDHVVPQSTEAGKLLICDYSNLVYACIRCNTARKASNAIDPTKVAFSAHFQVGADGSIKGLTTEGQDVVDLLGLDEEEIRETRREILTLVEAKEACPDNDYINELYLKKFSYPKFLPDLRTYRPKGNSLKAGLNTTHYARKAAGKLAPTY